MHLGVNEILLPNIGETLRVDFAGEVVAEKKRKLQFSKIRNIVLMSVHPGPSKYFLNTKNSSRQ